ncbi:MAG TPA: hypothetical protein VMF91_07295 [Bryobacteraceae bacterium]|nr:hypothetical protein [Bryobacteraceae bacterium]
MQLSAESRWFWSGSAPDRLEEWFRGRHPDGIPAGGGKERRDEYIRDPNQDELGIKRRGEKPGVEVKGLVSSEPTNLSIKPFIGPIEIWTKWTSEALTIDPELTIAIRKLRWLRKFNTGNGSPREIRVDEYEQIQGPLPQNGCNVELTRLTMPDDEQWFTLGFEAFGSLLDVKTSLQLVAEVMADRRPPKLTGAICLSYPQFVKRFLAERRKQ